MGRAAEFAAAASAHLKERAWKVYDKQANKVVDAIGKNMEANRPAMTQMLHNGAGPTSPFYRPEN